VSGVHAVRIKLLTELVQGVKLIKLLGWSAPGG
jgi:hypothetical protein